MQSLHQRIVSGFVKSGKAVRPGHTWETGIEIQYSDSAGVCIALASAVLAYGNSVQEHSLETQTHFRNTNSFQQHRLISGTQNNFTMVMKSKVST